MITKNIYIDLAHPNSIAESLKIDVKLAQFLCKTEQIAQQKNIHENGRLLVN